MGGMSENAIVYTDALRPGATVEVRSSFDRGWKRGFLVESVDGGGYRLRRMSDGAVLPAVFTFDAVRSADG